MSALASEAPAAHIRCAGAQDADALSKLACASKAHWGYSDDQMAAWRDDVRVDAAAIAALPTYVIEVDGALCGFYQLAPHPLCWQLVHFWIAPHCMGRGLGRALFNSATEVASRGGAHAIEIDADPNAEPFYRACGAVKVGSVAAPIDNDLQRVRPQLRITFAGLTT